MDACFLLQALDSAERAIRSIIVLHYVSTAQLIAGLLVTGELCPRYSDKRYQMGWKRSLRFQTRFKLIFEYREVMTKEFHQLERSGDDCKSNENFFLGCMPMLAPFCLF